MSAVPKSMSADKSDGPQEGLARPPAHPVSTLQGPFEESMIESINDINDIDVPLDAISRRALLLDAPQYQRVIAGRWIQKQGEKYHPLWKLIAQMSFGLHLLARNLAKSDDEVMKILQGHVDDIDGFLEITSEDFDLSQTDMHERLKCLKLPLQHPDVFDRMLEDRSFRASILEGNEKIEHIVDRTTRAMKDTMKDVQKGFDATNVLDSYLLHLTTAWKRRTQEHEAVFIAMLGNVEGWRKAFMDLHIQGNKLGGTLNKLSEILVEMQRRAAVVSRRLLAKSQVMAQSATRSVSATGQNSSKPRPSPAHKPLPLAPDQRDSSRASSRNNHIVDTINRPDSGQKSNHRLSVESPSLSRGSPESTFSRHALNSPNTNLVFSSTSTTPDIQLQTAPHPLSNTDSYLLHANETPAELPAEVPEDVMRLAPVSINNRLSMTLGITSKDQAERRRSSIYYPKALGDLLKVTPSHQVLVTPQLRAPGDLSPAPNAESHAGFFSAHGQSPLVGIIVSGSEHASESVTSSVARDEETDDESDVYDEALEEGHFDAEPVQDAETVPEDEEVDGDDEVEVDYTTTIDLKNRVTTPPNRAFTSHAAVMEMASAPVELPATADDDFMTHRRSRQESMSSLGEPGPEIADDYDEVGYEPLEMVPETIAEHQYDYDVQGTSQEPSTSTIVSPIDPRMEEQFGDADSDFEDRLLNAAAASRVIFSTTAEAAFFEPFDPKSTEADMNAIAQESSETLRPPSALKVATEAAPLEDESDSETEEMTSEPMPETMLQPEIRASSLPESEVELQEPVVAELEASVPSEISTRKPDSPVELEAVQQQVEQIAIPTRRPSRPYPAEKAQTEESSGEKLNRRKSRNQRGAQNAIIGVPTVVEVKRIPITRPGPAMKQSTFSSFKERAEFYILQRDNQNFKPGFKPLDFGRGSKGEPEPIRPLKLKLARKDGKMVPVQILSPEDIPEEPELEKESNEELEAKQENDDDDDDEESASETETDTDGETQRLPPKDSSDIISNMIEAMAGGPRHSPTQQTRPLSVASSTSGKYNGAPAPPGPSGPAMVNPDFSKAQQFHGERKRNKSGSGGWKDLLSAATSPRNSTDGSPRATRTSSIIGTGSDLLTAAGKDVLWFKGDTKKSVGV